MAAEAQRTSTTRETLNCGRRPPRVQPGISSMASAAARYAPKPLPPVDDLPGLWAKLEAEFNASREAERTYDDTVAGPHWTETAGRKEPHPRDGAVVAEADRLTAARCTAEEALINSPAPDLAAVIWKLTYSRERWQNFSDWASECWEPVLADLRRLAVIAPDPLSEVLRLEALGTRMNGQGYTDAAWAQWDIDLEAAYQRILELPQTPENAIVRARATLAVCDGNLATLFTSEQLSISQQLALQAIGTLAAGRH